MSLACFLVLMAGNSLFAQYKGAPVQKSKLLSVLRSKQLPTGDIVKIINSNGVNFELTPAVRDELINAGASADIIDAVLNNFRTNSKNLDPETKSDNKSGKRKASSTNTPSSSYNGLVEQAMASYKKAGNVQNSVRLLGEATRLEPKNPAAYQSLAYVFLYGLGDYAQSEKYSREAINLGGAAQFRVFHDDNGSFTKMCEGTLYVYKDKVRFVSDSNAHVFESAEVNIEDINLDDITTSLWKKRSVFKIVLRGGGGKDDSSFRFAPSSEKSQESQLIRKMIRKV